MYIENDICEQVVVSNLKTEMVFSENNFRNLPIELWVCYNIFKYGLFVSAVTENLYAKIYAAQERGKYGSR